MRLCSRACAYSAAAFVSFGCAGQNIEGTWSGPLPIDDAKACRIRIYSDHRFDVSCGDVNWAGAGRYEREGNQLSLRFSSWVHLGEARREKPDLQLEFEGQGNTLRVGEKGSPQKPLVWRRVRL